MSRLNMAIKVPVGGLYILAASHNAHGAIRAASAYFTLDVWRGAGHRCLVPRINVRRSGPGGLSPLGMNEGLDRRDYDARRAGATGIARRADAGGNPHADAELIGESFGAPKCPRRAAGSQAEVGKPAGSRAKQCVWREAGPKSPLQALMPLAFIVTLRLVVHEGVAEFEQSLHVLVRGASFIEALCVDGLERHLVTEHQRRSFSGWPERLQLRVGLGWDRAPVVSGALELQVQLV